MKALKKVLIANRGEIAVRIIRTCRIMGIRTVALYSDPDRTSLHVELADEAYPLKGTRASETYLDSSRIIAIARECGADAVHPGYGFLSENPDFAEAVERAGLVFIGPPAEAIRTIGNKTSARNLATRLGIPILPGSSVAFTDAQSALAEARTIGFPVLLKAAAGGGGKGMRLVETESAFTADFSLATSEASSSFKDGRIFIEKFLRHPHHVEIQVLADNHGNAVALGERDCSVQRRHQKIIEESPSPVIDAEMRSAMSDVAVRLVVTAGYRNAGTVEFLVDKDRTFYFLEVNTRLQVEHPVTELVTGLDLVKEQISIASGMELSLSQSDVRIRGHAIECRVYAEDPSNGFFPAPGILTAFESPAGPHVRVDSGARQGDSVGVHYDPLLAKVICAGPTRTDAIRAMINALEGFVVGGVPTTIPFCRFILGLKAFHEGSVSTQMVTHDLMAEYLKQEFDPSTEAAAMVAAALFASPDAISRRQPTPKPSGKWVRAREESYR